MTSMSARPYDCLRQLRPSRLLPVLALAFLLLAAPSAFAITRATVLARAQSWVDIPVKYSQHVWFRGYRTDCSGFTSMSWQTKVRGHAYSYSTRSLQNASSIVASVALLPGDALVKYDYHARIFYGWLDATHTDYVCYEQTGPTTVTTIQNIARDIAAGYKPYRRDGISNGPRPWNASSNPTFDVWWRGTPIWWTQQGGSRWTSVCTRTVDIAKTGKWALGLINPSGRIRDFVGISQVATVTGGAPYTLSMWAKTAFAPAGLELHLQFFDAAGDSLASTMTTGARSGLGATSMQRMSLTTTAPADATSATITVRLAGGVDATGTAGTTATVDAISLYDSSPTSMTFSVSHTAITRGQYVTLSGAVTSPIPSGTVRLYVTRPGKTKPVAWLNEPLVRGAWSLTYKPAYRGTYRYTATYLGYGPYGPKTSAGVLKVK